MKKVSLIFALALCLYIMPACNNEEKPGDTIEVKTIPGKKVAVSEDDAKFAIKTFELGANVLELSTYAKDKVASSKVKTLIGKLMDEQGKANAGLMSIANAKNIVLSTSLSIDGQNAQTELEQQTGSDLDKAYIDIMKKEHDNLIELLSDAATHVNDAQLKAYAVKALPTLKENAKAIDEVDEGLK
ncbi:MAG TPA: DUF4142 domain-containing protein [Mucilaginibacter sp.]|jgi:putative membrane protein|nr:DUF4142 domain-containing protein [Mucilaginibacter sp.]